MSTGPERGKQREAAERFSQERMGWRKQVGGSLHLRTGSPEKDGSTMPCKHSCQEPWDTLLHSQLPRPPDHGPKKTRPVRVSWGSEMTPFLQLLPPPSPRRTHRGSGQGAVKHTGHLQPCLPWSGWQECASTRSTG